MTAASSMLVPMMEMATQMHADSPNQLKITGGERIADSRKDAGLTNPDDSANDLLRANEMAPIRKTAIAPQMTAGMTASN